MKNIFYLIGMIVITTISCSPSEQPNITPEEAREIARDAYTYGFPVVDNYRVQYAFFVNRKDPDFKGSRNQVINNARVFTHEDKTVQSPNSDTPYSQIGFDLRTEPLVLTMPKIDSRRYYSVQLIDAYTHNFAYIGSRSTGNDAGNYLLAGPNWKGEKPTGIKAIIRSETDFGIAVYRTQLFNPADLDNVKKIQTGYQVQALSDFLGTEGPAAAPIIDFIKPLSRQEQESSVEFFNILNFALKFTQTHPSEKELMARFAKLDIGPGLSFDAETLPREIRSAVKEGMKDAWQSFAVFVKQLNSGETTAKDVFGTREHLKNNYIYRMAGAKLGIYGNSVLEAMYPVYFKDATGETLDGSQHNYTLRFEPGQLPPVHAF